MYKLVILITLPISPDFDVRWPEFLHAAERIPGLCREATSLVNRVLFGELRCQMIHELYFDSRADLDHGLNSPEGQQAGQLLQAITGGQIVLLLADHREDDPRRIRKLPDRPAEDDHL